MVLNMIDKIADILRNSLDTSQQRGQIKQIANIPAFVVEIPKEEQHGDYAANLALMISRDLSLTPGKIAEIIIGNIENKDEIFDKIEIAGPGFINFFISKKWCHNAMASLIRYEDSFAGINLGAGEKVQVEFVSANPTGPLHIGHGRGAAVGDSLANILKAVGYDVQKEYYINDAGTQIQTLGKSILARYYELNDMKCDFPENGYRGKYIYDIADRIRLKEGNKFLNTNKEDAENILSALASGFILDMIRDDLEKFRVEFNSWFSESTLYDKNSETNVFKMMEYLREKGLVYEEEGAWWSQTSIFGDDKDRVLIRSNGQPTYFASDITYHYNKFSRGFSKVIDIWGADHHGYVPRMKAAIEAMGFPRNALEVLLIQLVTLSREGKPVAMSTRAGEFVTLAEVIEEVGVDAARFTFLLRRHDSPLDFDLELVKKQSSENPVFYVQYAHARICNILQHMSDEGIDMPDADKIELGLLNSEDELRIIKKILQYPAVLINAARSFEPHRIAYYLNEMAGLFHSYYNKSRIISEDLPQTYARVALVRILKNIFKNNLEILGVSAPENM